MPTILLQHFRSTVYKVLTPLFGDGLVFFVFMCDMYTYTANSYVGVLRNVFFFFRQHGNVEIRNFREKETTVDRVLVASSLLKHYY